MQTKTANNNYYSSLDSIVKPNSIYNAKRECFINNYNKYIVLIIIINLQVAKLTTYRWNTLYAIYPYT